jgi:hypothetical protein
MDELFSCRNCVHNCGQSLTIGHGAGYCLQHESVIRAPERTTCKYLHRKDLPHFVVDEGVREHAAEFAGFARLVALDTKEAIERIPYSEKYQWEHGSFDPITRTVAQYYKVGPRWALISAFAGSVDGRRSLAYGSLVRHYMDRCGTWTSSYRLVLALVQELDVEPTFDPREVLPSDGSDSVSETQNALWDVVFVRLSALQEYGWHAGLDVLMWASDALNGALAEPDWPRIRGEFARLRESWGKEIIQHAKAHNAFFPPPMEFPTDAYDES